ncbi:hypothetical protein [Alicyclobacillus fodiniaquatilis]|uniref:Nucleotidyltransferase domain-containing protein n=1 Tax=Alicyclobacillus fodiniaquatilis TaxID=1661150 RepID=A0ABW4JFQ9_9BACL
METVEAVLSSWKMMRRPIVGAFIHGSVAQRGTCAPGSDIDLSIITPQAPDPAWFEERDVAGHIVEIYPLGLPQLADEESILSSPALPFNLCQGIIVFDPDHSIQHIREQIRPQLCQKTYLLRRAEHCYKAASTSYADARAALEKNDGISAAQFGITVGLWNAIGLACAIECRCPTMRRGFVHIWHAAETWNRPDVIVLAQRALGSAGVTGNDLCGLAEIAGVIKARNRAGILAMVENGEVEQAAFPLLCGAIWAPEREENWEARQQILRFFGYHQRETLQERLEAAELLTELLWGIGQSLHA